MIDHVAELLRRLPARRPGEPGTPRRPRDARRTARLAAAWTGGLLSLSILAVSGFGWAVTDAMDAATVRADIFGGLSGRPDNSPATDILIVGSDGRGGLDQNARDKFHTGSVELDAEHSDTMILAQLAADKKSLTLVSIPRDSYVTIPAWKGRAEHKEKINAALDIGGPALTVETVERLTGIRVDHFVSVNFSAFSSIVDAVGGVDVCLPKAVNDELSGLNLPAGVSHVGGVQALAYVRARYALTGGSDLGRIHRQQEFLGSLAQRVESSDVMADPTKFAGLVRAVGASLQTDSGLDNETMLDLALAIKSLPRDRMRFVSVPLADVDYQVPGVGSTVLWDPTLSGNLFEALRKDRPVEEVVAQAATAPAPAPVAAPVPAPAAASAPPVKHRAHAKQHVVAGTPLAVRGGDQDICH